MARYLVFSILALTPIVHSYKIDTKSCDQSPIDFINNSLADAFEMGRKAREELEKPLDPGFDRLIKLLFAQSVNGERGIWNTLFDVEYMAADKKNDASFDTDENEVLIHCDAARFEMRADGNIYDKGKPHGTFRRTESLIAPPKDRNVLVEDPRREQEPLVLLGNGKVEDCEKAKAQAFVYTILGHPADMTICPWFLTEEMKSGPWRKFEDKLYQFYAKLMPTSVKSFLGKPQWMTEFDEVVRGMDLTLLHELTHTAKIKAEDVCFNRAPEFAANSYRQEEIDGKRAYGWTLATRLALKDSYDALNNADSFAMFAAAVRLLRMSTPVYVSDSGRVSKKNPLARRDLFDQLGGSNDTAAIETFVTKVRERSVMETAV
ncbi:hypothetical protein PRZ48_012226 [Zasmidium cellare]|uniref:Lysine-specific metallo-endopeptidase domain-containing protein n=1 Tax=Zasmidium cellare TaxID=395010 RepID=A0ABR0E494_ZASCE|nr:hypothetical protein PRZ48_012226 [Zasmidium cellare]